MIGAVADARGEAVAVLDWNAFRFGIDAFRVEIKRDDFDLIGVSALTSQYKYVKQIVPILREAHPDAVIMLGGGILTSQPEDMMKWLDIDVGVIGEGENTMHELLDVVFSRRFGEVRGIIYRDEKGRIKRSEPRPLIGMKDCGFYEELDDLPYPAWELSPLEVYLRNSSIPLGPYAIRATARFDLSTERGCPKRCDFCIPPGTLVNTSEYLVPIDELVQNNSLNVKVVTHTGTLKPIINVFKHPYHGSHLVKLRLRKFGIPLLLSPDHKVFAISKGEGRKLKRADRLLPSKRRSKGDKIILPFPKVGQIKKKLDLAEILDIPVQPYQKSVKFKGGKVSVRRTVHVDKDFCRLVGYYLSEGYCNKKKNRPNSYTISFTFKDTEKEYINDVKQLLHKCFHSPKAELKEPTIIHREHDKAVAVSYSNSVLGVFFSKLFGSNAYNKKIPNWFFGLSREEITEVLVGWLRGDGTPSYVEGVTSSKQLAMQLFLLAYRARYTPKLYIKEEKASSKIDGRLIVPTGPSYVVRFDKGEKSKELSLRTFGVPAQTGHPHSTKFVGKTKRPFGVALSLWKKELVPYKGSVYNLEVKGHHTYTANLIGISNCQHLGMSSWDLGRIWNRKVVGPPVRFFSAKYVVDMVKQLRFKYKADFISFLDENFLINQKRAFEIAELWEEEGLAGLVRFGCLGSVDAADYDLLQKLRDVGLDYVSYGGECANDYVLKSMGKNTTVVQMQDAIDNTMKAGVNPIMTFMVGHPSDSLESVYDTIQFFIRNQINCVPFFCTPYVGTQLYEKYKDKILEQYDGDLEAYVTALDDATQFCVNLTKWNDAELIGLKDMMARCDLRALKRFAELKNEKVRGLDD